MPRITIDVSEDEDLSMKDAGISVGESGLSDVSLTVGQLEVVMTWEQIVGLHDALTDWLKPDDAESAGAVVANDKSSDLRP